MPEFPGVRPDGQDISLVALSALRPNPENPRLISETDFLALKKRVEENPNMLWTRPIVVWRERDVIIMGNMRYQAAKALGWQNVPAVYVSLDEKTAQRWMILDNNSFGDWEETALAEQLHAMSQMGEDITTLGLSESFLSGLGVLSDEQLAIEEETRNNYYQVVVTFASVDDAYTLARSLNNDGYQSVDVLVKTPRTKNKKGKSL